MLDVRYWRASGFSVVLAMHGASSATASTAVCYSRSRVAAPVYEFVVWSPRCGIPFRLSAVAASVAANLLWSYACGVAVGGVPADMLWSRIRAIAS